MNHTVTQSSLGTTDESAALACREALSAGTTPEPVAAPLVGTGEMVGLGSESAGYTVYTWLALRLDDIEQCIASCVKNREYRAAHELGLQWTHYNTIRAKIGTALAAAKKRQPQPNQ
jgi:hypothetical protein